MEASIKIIASVSIIGMLLGCVSVEGTRQRLNSKDPSEVKKAEADIYAMATHGDGLTEQQQVEYVNLTSNQGLLLRIIDDARSGKVIAAATERLDFSQKGAAHSFVKKRFEKLKKVDEKRSETLKEQIVSKLTQEELLDLIGDEASGSSKEYDLLLDRLIAIADSPAILWQMLDGNMLINDYRKKEAAKTRLLTMLDRVTDAKMIEKILNYRDNFVINPEQRILLMKKLPENKMVEFALAYIRRNGVYEWDKGKVDRLETGLGVVAFVKDVKSVVKIVAAFMKEIAGYRRYCDESWTMRWDDNDEKLVRKLVSGLPPLSDTAIAVLVCMDDNSWKYFIEKVTPSSAYTILTHGKAKSEELEVALVKKLPASNVDLKVLAGVKTDTGKKAVMAAMPADIKKVAEESVAKALAIVMDKAKDARKGTFEMHGFYLGMDWEDMKLVLAHHFPDFRIAERRDGDAKNADYVVYVPRQSTPFCYASASDKKVYQFNFGKQILKKWYKYDVQTFMEWAHKYSAETGIDMKFKMINEDTEVYESDMSRSYKVWFHQETYQYKHNTKEFRLIYFGEEKDYTVHGGIAGALIKEEAAKDFRYIRDDPGTLRARIERN